ncbi:MAG: AMP-binding protein, partial [Saprospiraceae bacterium]|nr:AMP-binding protein [Saprospiraceae bacterium]
MLNLSVILEDSAQRYPTKDAFISHGEGYTFTQINQSANKVAQSLIAMGVEHGDKVALSCPNLPYFPIIYFGILKAGAVVVPLSILLKSEEVKYHLTDSDAKVYFCFEGTDTLPMGAEGLAGFNKCSSCQKFVLIAASGVENPTFSECMTLQSVLDGSYHTFESIRTSAEDTAVIIYT